MNNGDPLSTARPGYQEHETQNGRKNGMAKGYSYRPGVWDSGEYVFVRLNYKVARAGV